MNTHLTNNSAQNTLPEGLLKTIAKLGFPVAIQSALVAILALADVLMVSDFGKEATAAVGIASKWHFIAIMIMAGLASANGTLVAQYWGKDDRRSAKAVSLIALNFGLKVLIPVSLLITLGSQFIMMLQTNDKTVIELGSVYLWYALPVLLLTHIVIVIESSMRSSGDTVTPLFIGSVTIFVNIALNYWLIKGGLGVPAMGVAGAALATSISRALQVVLMLGFMKYKRHWLLETEASADRPSLWLSYRRLALPVTLGAVLWGIGTMAYQIIFGHMGTTELAVFSMLGPFESLCYAIFFGISVACSVLIGQSLGRNEFDRAQAMAAYFIKVVFVVGVSVGAFMLLNREWILSGLNLNSEELKPLAAPAVIILCCGIWIRMLNMTIINGIIRAGGDNVFCLRMDFIAMWMTGIPLCALAAFIAGMEFKVVYALMLAEEIVKLALCYRRYTQKFWIKNLTVVTVS
ncbi:MATE family efflux transporter [Vibrio sp. IRLE0018]|uniref:MATE family efflux transporter n=1 Tax=Vibrio TaxID=662 RepID=UPI0015943038|nr:MULTISPECIES: MATE family efflux transporter [Vibrio]MCF8777937.1 MATE family efflux transporter [Vibrio floridensis]NVC64193.1 MATE family efflux transporter [Vibrio sp. 05-20-BW147]HAS6347094.1 MATE family efflux transporter [Vibrio vulnificus]